MNNPAAGKIVVLAKREKVSIGVIADDLTTIPTEPLGRWMGDLQLTSMLPHHWPAGAITKGAMEGWE